MSCVWGELGGQPLQGYYGCLQRFWLFQESSDDITWFLDMYELMEWMELFCALGNEAMVIVDEAR